MKKWALVLYAFIVLALLAPAMLLLASSSTPAFSDFMEFYQVFGLWIIAGFLILCQFALLTLSVDTTQKGCGHAPPSLCRRFGPRSF